MPESNDLNAWEYHNGQWTPIKDPCDSAIDEASGMVEEGLAKWGIGPLKLLVT